MNSNDFFFKGVKRQVVRHQKIIDHCKWKVWEKSIRKKWNWIKNTKGNIERKERIQWLNRMSEICG